MNRRRFGPGGESGQSLVEFALVVPLLLLVLVGIIEFGRAWNISQAVAGAARQGARLAAVLNGRGLTADPIQDSVRQAVSTSLASSNINCGSCVDSIPGAGGGANSPVSVWVSVPYRFMILAPVMRLTGQNLDSASIKLRSGAVMRNE